MTRRLTALSLAVAGVAGVLASGPQFAGAAPAARDLRTTARVTSAHRLDLGRRGRSAGDVTVIAGRLLGPDLRGRYEGYCVSISRVRQQCSFSFVAPGGQIAAQAAYGSATTALTPIVGGSGRYAGARGDISEREIQGGREDRLVFHLMS